MKSMRGLASASLQPSIIYTVCVTHSELYIFDIWNDNLQSFNREKNEASVPVFYADWTSVPVPRTSSLRGLDVGFIPLLPKELPYMANNDEYTDEYNDEYLCRDFLSVSIFGRGYHSRYQNFEFTGHTLSREFLKLALTGPRRLESQRNVKYTFYLRQVKFFLNLKQYFTVKI